MPGALDHQETVLAERRGAVAVLTLNRPARLNAWTDELERRYFGLLDEAEDDPDVRAVVVTGAGRGFCAGADLADLTTVSRDGASALPEPAAPRHRPLLLRKPLIAAINGAAAGLGLVEALYCDVRFAAPDAKLTTAFARRGLIAEYGIAWLLPRIVGPGRALDLLLSARIVDGREAAAIGLVDRLVEPAHLLDAAVDYAQQLADHCSPTSMHLIKTQVHRALDSDFESAATEAHRLMLDSFAAPDCEEGVASHLEGRPPVFPGLAPLGR
ncbi:enoyl-CoA hydratase/carnithine racemase [Nocardioides sp. J9]|uniref:enoyl-CoA hydratase-related protein n=1 Tax=unclassified Nocardioides TaxID=2615069 RepID=UPI00048C2DCD|nr:MULTISPECIES: enoyl-CoA hydratase-related protein [unclassified Nocardioides]TWH02677.1 enoyl-CoA hydratase/carnithine racemase [Nocardioides sp. J9]